MGVLFVWSRTRFGAHLAKNDLAVVVLCLGLQILLSDRSLDPADRRLLLDLLLGNCELGVHEVGGREVSEVNLHKLLEQQGHLATVLLDLIEVDDLLLF